MRRSRLHSLRSARTRPRENSEPAFDRCDDSGAAIPSFRILSSARDGARLHSYEGGCHCGAVHFAIETDLSELTTCNCSICRRKNALMVQVHTSRFTLLSGAQSLTEYRFHMKTACRSCARCAASIRSAASASLPITCASTRTAWTLRRDRNTSSCNGPCGDELKGSAGSPGGRQQALAIARRLHNSHLLSFMPAS